MSEAELLRPGVVLKARYRVDQRGATGVFEGRDLQAGRRAIAISPAVPSEVQTLEQLVGYRSVGLAEVLDLVALAPGRHVVVFELLSGPTLEERISELGQHPLREAVGLLVPVVDTLAALHREGVVHGSVEPRTIFLTEEAKLGHAPGPASPSPFRTPERNLGGRPTPRDDVWGFSAALYNVITGEPPPQGGVTAQSLQGIEDEALRALLLLGLAVSPSARAPDCGTLRGVLVAWLEGLDRQDESADPVPPRVAKSRVAALAETQQQQTPIPPSPPPPPPRVAPPKPSAPPPPRRRTATAPLPDVPPPPRKRTRTAPVRGGVAPPPAIGRRLGPPKPSRPPSELSAPPLAIPPPRLPPPPPAPSESTVGASDERSTAPHEERTTTPGSPSVDDLLASSVNLDIAFDERPTTPHEDEQQGSDRVQVPSAPRRQFISSPEPLSQQGMNPYAATLPEQSSLVSQVDELLAPEATDAPPDSIQGRPALAPVPSDPGLDEAPLPAAPLPAVPLPAVPLPPAPTAALPPVPIPARPEPAPDAAAPATQSAEPVVAAPVAAELDARAPQSRGWMVAVAVLVAAGAGAGLVLALSGSDTETASAAPVETAPEPSAVPPMPSASAAAVASVAASTSGSPSAPAPEKPLTTFPSPSACVVAVLPGGKRNFKKPPELESLCSEADPRKGALSLKTAIVAGGTGGVSPAMGIWSRLGWYDLPAYALVQRRCCSTPPEVQLPEADPGCEAMAGVIQSVATKAVSSTEIESELDAYSKNVACEVSKLRAGVYWKKSKESGGQRAAFEKLVKELER